jgi:hypothetical protein
MVQTVFVTYCYYTENSGKVCKSLILGGAYSHKSLILLYAKKFSGVFSITAFYSLNLTFKNAEISISYNFKWA